MRQIFTHPKDLICPDSRSLQAGYPRRGGRHSSPEPKVRQRAGFIGQHPRTQASEFGNFSAPESQIGRGSGFNSTRPPKYKGSIPNSARANRNSTPLQGQIPPGYE